MTSSLPGVDEAIAPNVDHLITEDDTPVDNFSISEAAAAPGELLV